MRSPPPAISMSITCCMQRGPICCAESDRRRKRRKVTNAPLRWRPTRANVDFLNAACAKFSRRWLNLALSRRLLLNGQSRFPGMLIDSFAPNPDAVETHRIAINASPDVVYRALWTADLGNPVIKLLLGLRMLPGFILRGCGSLPRNQEIT